MVFNPAGGGGLKLLLIGDSIDLNEFLPLSSYPLDLVVSSIGLREKNILDILLYIQNTEYCG